MQPETSFCFLLLPSPSSCPAPSCHSHPPRHRCRSPGTERLICDHLHHHYTISTRIRSPFQLPHSCLFCSLTFIVFGCRLLVTYFTGSRLCSGCHFLLSLSNAYPLPAASPPSAGLAFAFLTWEPILTKVYLHSNEEGSVEVVRSAR